MDGVELAIAGGSLLISIGTLVFAMIQMRHTAKQSYVEGLERNCSELNLRCNELTDRVKSLEVALKHKEDDFDELKLENYRLMRRVLKAEAASENNELKV